MGKDKKEKKEKKSKKEKRPREEDAPEVKKPKTEESGETVRIKVPIAVPFSNDHENLTKKVLSIVKHATKAKTMVRGIKEVTKIIRKEKANKDALVVLAADISPLDVISHMPVLCQDKGVCYYYVISISLVVNTLNILTNNTNRLTTSGYHPVPISEPQLSPRDQPVR